MTVNALVELDKKLTSPPAGDGLAALEEKKRTLQKEGTDYAREVQRAVQNILGAVERFKEGWDLFRREVLAGHAEEVQRLRDRFIRAFEEQLVHLQEAHELVHFASQVAASDLPEGQQLREEIAALRPMLQTLAQRWRTREDLERLVGEDQDSARIVKTSDVCGGDARVKGTRISVWGLEEWRRLGWSDARILDAYPQLKPEDLDAAWAYVEQHPAEIERAIQENREA